MATTKKKTTPKMDDDSYVNLMYGLGAAKAIGDTKKLAELKKANPAAYAEWEKGQTRKTPAKKTTGKGKK